MKPSTTVKAMACLAFCAFTLHSARADFATDARAVFESNAPSVFGVQGLLEVNVTMNGQQAGNQEQPLWSNAAVVGEGLLVVAYKSLKPDVGTGMGSRPGLEIETELSELKLIDESGEEYEAKLVLHDEDLGLAFIAIDPSDENAGSFQAKPLDLSKDVDVKHLDRLVSIGRASEDMRFQANVRTGEVIAIVKRPRKLISVSNARPSTPVFDQTGGLVGFVVVPKAKEGSKAGPVVIPTKYVRDLIDQAKEKQAKIGEEEPEDAAEKDEPDEEEAADAAAE